MIATQRFCARPERRRGGRPITCPSVFGIYAKWGGPRHLPTAETLVALEGASCPGFEAVSTCSLSHHIICVAS